MTSTVPRSRAFKALMVLASFFVALLLAEVILRYFFPVQYLKPTETISQNAWGALVHQQSGVPGLGYELKPNLEKQWRRALIRTNSYGMRDRERHLEKKEGVFRIAVLGDSFTFGLGVENQEAYSSVLEILLNEPGTGPSYEVLNFGVTGYSTRDEALVLRHKVLQWNPDLIVIGYVVNDPETDPIPGLQAYYDKPSWWQRSQLLRLIAKVKNNWDIKRYGGGDYNRYLYRYPAKWQTVLDGFADIREVTSTKNIKVLLVVFPMSPEISNQVRKAASDSGFSVADMSGPFSAHGREKVRLPAPDNHPSAFGHQVIAQAIRDALISNQLLPK